MNGETLEFPTGPCRKYREKSDKTFPKIVANGKMLLEIQSSGLGSIHAWDDDSKNWFKACEELSFSVNKKNVIAKFKEKRLYPNRKGYFLDFRGELNAREEELQIQVIPGIKNGYFLINYGIFRSDKKDLTKKRKVYKFKISFPVSFGENRPPERIFLSGNAYQRFQTKKIIKDVPRTGAMAGVWGVGVGKVNLGLAGINRTGIHRYKARITGSKANISIESMILEGMRGSLVVFCGDRPFGEMVFLHHSRFNPPRVGPLYKGESLLQVARKAFSILAKHCMLKTEHGSVPSNFVIPKRNKESDEPDSYTLHQLGSIGNCFRPGYLYGTSSIYQWTKNEQILDFFKKKLLPPVLKGSQITNGPMKGAFFDTYSKFHNRWTTGRVQLSDRGFTDWLPCVGGQGFSPILANIFGAISPKLILWNIKNFSNFLTVIKTSSRHFEREIIFPIFTGETAYFLTRIYSDSVSNGHFLGENVEDSLLKSLKLAASNLLTFQRSDGLWDHEMFFDGSTYWSKRTLGSIFPLTFLYWLGSLTGNKEYVQAAEKGLKSLPKLLNRESYHGVYFETDLSIEQDDLVTALACVSCYSTLYELTNDSTYLNRGRHAANHGLSYMWQDGTIDSRGNNIGGAVTVTTYRSLGFPVIGGSEQCQFIEAMLEISKFDKRYLRFAEAGFNFHSQYLWDNGGTWEINWGHGGDWTTSHSLDYASYAAGPLIHALYLYEHLKQIFIIR